MSADYNRNGRPARFSNLDDKLKDERKVAVLRNCQTIHRLGTDADYQAWVDAGPELNGDFYKYTVDSLAYFALYETDLQAPELATLPEAVAELQKRAELDEWEKRRLAQAAADADREAETHNARYGF